jgi:hypothetical protein
MRAKDAEVYEGDHQADRQTIQENRESPGVAGIPLEHEPALGATLDVMGPTRKQ